MPAAGRFVTMVSRTEAFGLAKRYPGATLAAMSDFQMLQNAADLRAALQAGHLERAELGAVDLPPTDVGAVRLNHVRMLGTKLVGLGVGHLQAARVQARGVLLRGSRFEKAELQNWDVSASQAQEIQWPAAKLQDCRFHETPLTNANLQRAILVGCDFHVSDLNHARLSESMVLHTRFSDSRQGGAVLDNADLSGAVLCQVDLRGANLFRASFAHAVLIGVDLRDANLVGVRFQDAVLIDCKTERADLGGGSAEELARASGSLGDVFERLRQLPAEHLAMMTAALLVRGGAVESTAASPSAAVQAAADPLAALLRMSFAGLIRELQGRGGPTELGQLRTDGEHVYARGTGGEEVRLTQATRDAPRQAAPMRTPDPTTPAPAPPRSAPAVPAPAPGRHGGLEID